MSMTLLKEKKFSGFFWTQFFGAFNDNIFKNALLIMITFKFTDAESGILTNLAAGLFILPFFLLSPWAGQICDKFEKSKLIRRIKMAEIGIMLMGAYALFIDATYLLLAVLFLTGAQSAFFGPVKFAILPQTLKEEELIAANGLVEMATFMAILLGTILGGLLYRYLPDTVGFMVVGIAVLGFIFSNRIPQAKAAAPELTIRWNPVTIYSELVQLARKRDSVFRSIIGISWFWFLGSVILVNIPGFVKHSIGGDATVITLLFATFSIAVAAGSLLCETLSQKEIEIGIVPIGAFGMSYFLIDILSLSLIPHTGELLGALGFMESFPQSFRILLDLFGIGFFGSFYVVPLNTLIQVRSEESTRSRLISACNIMNAIFMVAAALFGMVLTGIGVGEDTIFVILGFLNLGVAIYIFLLVPEFVLRFITWILTHTVYKLKIHYRHHIPKEGAAIIIANHVSFIDFAIITATCKRPVRFVIYHKIFQIPILHTIFKLGKGIPIAPQKEDHHMMERAFREVSECLKNGDIVCIFPEGQITKDGEMTSFRPGIARMLKENPVQVIPMALHGLWGSFFSRKGGAAMSSIPKPSRRTIHVNVGEPLPAETSIKEMQSRIEQLLEEDQK